MADPSALPIYLDSLATTPVDPRVVEAMLPHFTEAFGNAASITHAHGWRASEAVEAARETIAALIGAEPREIIFASGATEAANLALKGFARAHATGKRRRIVTCTTEHHAVLDPLDALEREGWEVVRLPVAPDGTLDPADVQEALGDETLLVSIMHANNETGTIQDIAAIGALCEERGAVFHTDATQAVGKIPFDVRESHVHLANFSAHKLYGPKGVGALYVRRKGPRVRLRAEIEGGGHERGLRSGTLNVPGIVGFARALEIACAEREAEAARLAALRDRLRAGLFEHLDAIEENGAPNKRLPHALNVAIHYVDSAALLNELPELALSTGSACSSADPEPSHVLLAMGRSEEHARSSVRFGLHRFTREEEVNRALELVVGAVRRLRAHSPLYAMRNPK